MMWFCVKPERAAQAFQTLRDAKANTATPAYLAVRRALLSGVPGKREPTIAATVKTFFDDYLLVGGSADRPYLRPFTHRGGISLLTPHVAGSFAWSNAAPKKTMERFLDHLEGEDPDYGLKPNHPTLARDALLKERLPTDALLALLYRDLAFEADAPSFAPLLDRFAREFDFRADGGGLTSEFRVLFSELPDDLDPNDWFEPCEPAPTTDPQEADDEA